MKLYHFSLITLLSIFCVSLSGAQQPALEKKKGVTTDHTVIVPPAVAQSAQLAVQTLGNKVKQGDLLYAYNKMYPRFKKRQEVLHGADRLKQAILNANNGLIKMGVTIEKFQAQRPTGFFRVWPEIKAEVKAKIASGEQKATKPGDEVYHWMVIVPTKQTLAFLGQKGGRTRYAMVEEYQVAIAKEAAIPGQEKWTFISPVKVQEMRAMFPSLPANLLLPEMKKYEIKK